MNIRNIRPIALALVTIAALAAGVEAQRQHNVSVEAGKTRSSRYTSQLTGYTVSGSNGAARAWFDRRANKLRIQGLRPGTATIVFRGKVVRYIAGISPNRRLRGDRPFEDVIHVTVRAARRAARNNNRNPGNRNRGRRPAPRRPARQPAARRLPTIRHTVSKTLGVGRRGSVSLAKLFGGQAGRSAAASPTQRGVVGTDIARGRLTVQGKRRGQTTLYVRGKVMRNGQWRDIMVTMRLTVR